MLFTLKDTFYKKYQPSVLVCDHSGLTIDDQTRSPLALDMNKKKKKKKKKKKTKKKKKKKKTNVLYLTQNAST